MRRRYLEIAGRFLEIVDGGGCGVAAAGRGGPRDGVRSPLGRLPSRSLLRAVVPPAFRVQVALVRGAVRIRNRVVEVAEHGLGVAGGCGAGLVAGTEQVPELAARDVSVFGVPVIAGVPGDGLEGDGEAAQQVR